jgi:hypothetical protein
MKIKDLEKRIIQYCQDEKIPVINGQIDHRYVRQVEAFVDVLKKTHKANRSFLKQRPENIGDIIKRMK